MSAEDKKKFSALRREELDILDELKSEPKVVDGKLNFERQGELYADLREVHAKMASLAN